MNQLETGIYTTFCNDILQRTDATNKTLQHAKLDLNTAVASLTSLLHQSVTPSTLMKKVNSCLSLDQLIRLQNLGRSAAMCVLTHWIMDMQKKCNSALLKNTEHKLSCLSLISLCLLSVNVWKHRNRYQVNLVFLDICKGFLQMNFATQQSNSSEHIQMTWI